MMKKMGLLLFTISLCFLTACNTQVENYVEEDEWILTSETTELSDGTVVEIWNSSHGTGFRLPNGVELLRVQESGGPENVYVGGIESLADLNKDAQKNIVEFYQRQGELYDVPAELEKAYNDYLQQEDAANFKTHRVSQEVVPTASSETVMYFLTSVMLPITEGLPQELSSTYGEDSAEEGTVYYEYYIGAAFDKETGEVIDNWELFSCPPEEVMETILEISEVSPNLKEEMKAAFEPGNMVFFSDSLEVHFPPGSLPSQKYHHILGLDYDERLLGILNEWAVPESNE